MARYGYGDPGAVTTYGYGGDPGDPPIYDPGDPWDPGDPGIVPGYYTLGRRWYASFSAVLMTRATVNSHELAYLGANPSASILNTRDTTTGEWRGGAEISLLRAFSSETAFELAFWGLSSFNTTKLVSSNTQSINSTLDFTTGGTMLIDGRPGTLYFDGSTQAQLIRMSETWNLELNWWNQSLLANPASRLTLTGIGGVRWFHFRDTLTYQSTVGNTTLYQYDGGNVGNYDIAVRNDLIGPQLGANLNYDWTPRWRFYGVPKIAAMVDGIEKQTALHCGCADGGTDGFHLQSQKTTFSMLGQLDLGTSWQARSWANLFIAYRALVVGNLATADDQVAQYMSNTYELVNIKSSGNLILHGVQMGAQLTY